MMVFLDFLSVKPSITLNYMKKLLNSYYLTITYRKNPRKTYCTPVLLVNIEGRWLKFRFLRWSISFDFRKGTPFSIKSDTELVYGGHSHC